ncbi:MAG: hypothetical protein JEZ09_01900 [Salinivirgaceae bacterium]|nr:hypothetical protein [Salinivirgaceae bacterium]
MNKSVKLSIGIFSFFIFHFSFLSAQESNSLYQNQSFRHFDRYVYKSSERFHTSVKPFLNSQVYNIVTTDSLNLKLVNSKAGDIIFNRSLIQFEKDDFSFTIDPLFNFEIGKDLDSSNMSYINTRGVLVNAKLGKYVSVSTSFYENQARFNDYRHARIQKLGRKVMPGQGYGKAFGDSLPQTYDYGFAEGYVSFTPSEHFNFTFGHGKNFIGDGYRSLLLSDNSFNYPYFRITTDFWNIKYVNIWSQYQDLTVKHPYGIPFDKKWSSMHYLDWSVTDWLNIGFFEAIIWQHADSTGVRGFDFNYANPVIFLRPVEFSVSSPDNAIMGINGKLTLFNNHILYGQAVIDEFKFSELKARNGWWANKWGIQAGYKTYDLFEIEHLDIQTEFNYVRPFMYSHNSTLRNYAHYNQPLAHPLGSNFWESVSFVRYNKDRIFFEGRISYAKHGRDTANLNFGNDLYKDYDTHEKEYDNYLGQAEEVNLIYATAQVAYLVNKRTNLNVYLKYTLRKESSSSINTNQGLITFGIRTSLQNFYYDF